MWFLVFSGFFFYRNRYDILDTKIVRDAKNMKSERERESVVTLKNWEDFRKYILWKSLPNATACHIKIQHLVSVQPIYGGWKHRHMPYNAHQFDRRIDFIILVDQWLLEFIHDEHFWRWMKEYPEEKKNNEKNSQTERIFYNIAIKWIINAEATGKDKANIYSKHDFHSFSIKIQLKMLSIKYFHCDSMKLH